MNFFSLNIIAKCKFLLVISNLLIQAVLCLVISADITWDYFKPYWISTLARSSIKLFSAQCAPPPEASCSCSSTLSKLNDAGFWRGGKSLKD